MVNVVPLNRREFGTLSKLSVLFSVSLFCICLCHVSVAYKFNARTTYDANNVFINSKDDINRRNCVQVARSIKAMVTFCHRTDVINMYAKHELYVHMSDDKYAHVHDLDINVVMKFLNKYVTFSAHEAVVLKHVISMPLDHSTALTKVLQEYRRSGLEDYFKYLRDCSDFGLAVYKYLSTHLDGLMICAQTVEDSAVSQQNFDYAVNYIRSVLSNYFGMYNTFYNHSRDVFNKRVSAAIVMNSEFIDMSTWVHIIAAYVKDTQDYVTVRVSSLVQAVQRAVKLYDEGRLNAASRVTSDILYCINLLLRVHVDVARHADDARFVLRMYGADTMHSKLVHSLYRGHMLMGIVK